MIIRPSFTVLSGAAIGLVAGAAVYGAVSTASAASSTSVKPPKVVAAAPTVAARCAAGQTLEDGVCIVHVVKTVVVPAPLAGGGAYLSSTQVAGVASETDRDGELSEHSDDATEVGEHDATEEANEEAAENQEIERGSELSGRDGDFSTAGTDDDVSDETRR